MRSGKLLHASTDRRLAARQPPALMLPLAPGRVSLLPPTLLLRLLLLTAIIYAKPPLASTQSASAVLARRVANRASHAADERRARLHVGRRRTGRPSSWQPWQRLQPRVTEPWRRCRRLSAPPRVSSPHPQVLAHSPAGRPTRHVCAGRVITAAACQMHWLHSTSCTAVDRHGSGEQRQSDTPSDGPPVCQYELGLHALWQNYLRSVIFSPEQVFFLHPHQACNRHFSFFSLPDFCLFQPKHHQMCCLKFIIQKVLNSVISSVRIWEACLFNKIAILSTEKKYSLSLLSLPILYPVQL